MRLLLIFLCACRFHGSAHHARPAQPQQVTIALDALDEATRASAHAVLRDPRVAVVDVHPAALASAKASCGGAPCEALRRAGCTWAAQGGAQYFALALSNGRYEMHDARTCAPVLWPPPPPAPVTPDIRHVEISVPLGLVGMKRGDDRGMGGFTGVNVRYYPRAGGIRLGAGLHVLSYLSSQIYVLAPELGIGTRVHRLLQLSTNLAVGRAWANGGFDEWAASAKPGVAAIFSLRAETYFARWSFLGADVGLVHTPTFDKWDNPIYDFGNVSARAPFVRLWWGLDF